MRPRGSTEQRSATLNDAISSLDELNVQNWTSLIPRQHDSEVMTPRECRSCTLWLTPDEFSTARPNYCHECERARPVVVRVAGIAANGIVRCRAAHALLNLGYVRAARIVLAGTADWPTMRQLRGPS